MAEDVTSKTKSVQPVIFKSATLPVDQIVVGQRFRKNFSKNLDRLKESIRKRGLLQPIVVREEDRLLVAGRRRLEAFRALGREKIPVRLVANLQDGLLLAERDENVEREPYSPKEIAALAKAIEPGIRAAAKRRQLQGGKRKAVGSSHKQPSRGRTRDQVAAQTGVSAKTLSKIEKLMDSGRSDLIEEMETTGKVDRVFRKLKVTQPLENRVRAVVSRLDRIIPDVAMLVEEVVANPEKGLLVALLDPLLKIRTLAETLRVEKTLVTLFPDKKDRERADARRELSPAEVAGPRDPRTLSIREKLTIIAKKPQHR